MSLGLALFLAYSVAGWARQESSLALSIFGNVCLIASAALVPIVILRRRREWAGSQRLFWDVIGVAMTLWIIGHVGWISDHSWLKWHTIFSICGGIGPLIALLARPHRGARAGFVAPTAMTIGAYWLFAVFLYSYFVLVPSLLPEAVPAAQARLLSFIQWNRLLLLAGMAAAVWFARGTDWRPTYLRLAVGVGIGFVWRISTSQAIARGDYQVGTFYDFAWIAPWLCYAWAAAEAPASPSRVPESEDQHEALSVGLLVVPALLIPLIGYSVLNLESGGDTVDSIRLFLTSLTTVVGLGIVTLRLAAQGSELQRADARLQLLAAATEHTGDLILITRPDGSFEHANTAFVRALGYSRDELAARKFVDLIEPGMDHLQHDIPAEVMAKSIWRGTLKGRRKDGSSFPAACTITAIRDQSGRLTHFVGVERDMTEDLALRDQLVHSERLSAIGELIAGVAHEINNPLQTIIGCTELMLDEPEGVNKTDLELVRKEAMRAGQIVRNLLAFARRGVSDRSPIDLNDLVRATAELRNYHLQQINITLVLKCASHPLPVAVNREEIRQVILNLLLNAEHAVASTLGGGTITVETSGNGAVQTVEVSDSGPGISPELRGRIFEPFFTTREVGEGTGLGLSISLGIASSHGGVLGLADSPSGARFRLTLPAHTESAALATGPLGAGVRALVVDDDAPIRKLIVRLLEKRGYEVSEAETGESAMALALDRRPGIVICDTGVRGMTGFDLYRRLAAKDADGAPRFLFISGEKTAVPADSDVAGVPVLSKPFTATDLETALVAAGIAAPRA